MRMTKWRWGSLFTVSRKLAKEEGSDKDGYRLIVNCNAHGGQAVYPTHLVGGRLLELMLIG